MTSIPELNGWYWFRGSYRNSVTQEILRLDWEIVKVLTASTGRGRPYRLVRAFHWSERLDRFEEAGLPLDFIPIYPPTEK